MKRKLLFLLSCFISFTVAAQDWTWLKGDSVTRRYGVYGNLGVSSPTNKPGSRDEATTWTDNSGNLWLFGGHGYTASEYYYDLNDLWKYNPSSNEWTWMKGDSLHQSYGIGGTQGVPNINNKPGPRINGMSWKDNSGNLWLFGGYGGALTGSGYLNDVWKYDISTNEWTWVAGVPWANQDGDYGIKGVPSASNHPGARKLGQTWTDASGRFWLFGGEISNTSMLNDLWMFDPVSTFWTWMGGGGSPTSPILNGRYGTRNVEDPLNIPWQRKGGVTMVDNSGDFWLFGGWGRSSLPVLTGYYNDLWKFNITTGNWTWVSGDTIINKVGVYGTLGVPAATNKPGSRAYGNGWIDNSGDVWLFGGSGYVTAVPTAYNNDLWYYNRATDMWTWKKGNNTGAPIPHYGTMGVTSPANTPGGRWFASSWARTTDNKFWLWGGNGLGTDAVHYLNDLWRFDPTSCATATINTQPVNSSICSGGNTSFSITASNAISYKWQEYTGTTWTDLINNATYGGCATNTLTITGVTPAMNNYQYRCVVNNTCGDINSAAATLAVLTAAIPSVTINIPSNNVCAGVNVTFTATPVNGGTTPLYQWTKNGGNVGTNSAVYTTNTLINGDIINCTMTSSLTCVTTPTASGNNVVMTVNAVQTPLVSITTSGNNVCAGTSVTFTASPVYGGTTPSFQWTKNGINTGSNSAIYTSSTLNNGDIIRCVMTSNFACVTSATATSNQVLMNIIAPVTPSINIGASATTICPGTLVTFSSVIVNGGTTPGYQWKKNGINVGSNAPTYSDNTLITGDVISCTVTSNATCLTTASAGSNNIAISLVPNIAVNLGANKAICSGSSLVISPQISYSSYLWQDGSTNASYTATTGGLYQVTVTDACGIISTDDILVTLNSKPANFLPADTTVCVNSPVLVTANSSFVSYLWNTNATTPSLNVTLPGTYWLEAKDNNGCTGRDSIAVLTKSCLKGLFVPTAFTPNGDTKNDIFRPILFGFVKQYEFSVYNRYGEPIFETKDPAKGWDGTIKGKMQNSGTFVWKCVYQIDNQLLTTEQGTVVLIK